MPKKPSRIYVACDSTGDVLMTSTNINELVDDLSYYPKSGTTVIIYEYSNPKETRKLAAKSS